MFSGFDLCALVDAVAVPMAEQLKSDLSVASAGTIRPWLLDVEQAAVGCTVHSVRHQIKASKMPIVRCESARVPRRRGSR